VGVRKQDTSCDSSSEHTTDSPGESAPSRRTRSNRSAPPDPAGARSREGAHTQPRLTRESGAQAARVARVRRTPPDRPAVRVRGHAGLPAPPAACRPARTPAPAPGRPGPGCQAQPRPRPGPRPRSRPDRGPDPGPRPPGPDRGAAAHRAAPIPIAAPTSAPTFRSRGGSDRVRPASALAGPPGAGRLGGAVGAAPGGTVRNPDGTRAGDCPESGLVRPLDVGRGMWNREWCSAVRPDTHEKEEGQE